MILKLFIALQLFAATPQNVCVEYNEYDVTTCHDERVGNAAAGGILGAGVGYLFGGKRGALWGAALGAGTGASSGNKKCITEHKKECVKWKEIK